MELGLVEVKEDSFGCRIHMMYLLSDDVSRL